MALKSLLVATIAFISVQATCDKDLIKPVEWIGASFDFPNVASKSIILASGRYISKNNIATRAQIFKDEAIVSLPRYKPGVPATLAKVSLKQRGCEASLVPFPNWSLQEEGNCNALQSVVDTAVDAQNVLWALDIGVVNTFENPLRMCPPKIVAINLNSGNILKTIDLSGIVEKASRLQSITVEYSHCGKPFVYVSDAATRSILVFDVVANKGTRVVLPKAVVGSSNRRDILYIVIVTKGCGNNYLVFTYLSGDNVFAIRTDFLRSGTTAGKIIDLGTKPKKLVILGTDHGSAVFFRYENEPEIYRWDANFPFKKEYFSVVYKSPPGLLSTHVSADLKRFRMRVLDSNFPDFIQNTVGCGALQQINLMIGTC